MSDDVETKTPDKKKAKKPADATIKEPAEPTLVEPIPRDLDLFNWLDGLFDGAQEFPELIELREMRGRNYDTAGPKLKSWNYPPASKKPPRERLVHITNEILHRSQMATDVRRKSIVFTVAATHFTHDKEPYSVFPFRCHPGKTYRNGENGDVESEDDEDGSLEKRFSVQMMSHLREMNSTNLEAWMAIADRQDRMLERVLGRQSDLETRHFRMFDMLERALTMEQEREEKRRRSELWNKGAEKIMDLVTAVAPPLVNSLMGKQVIPGAESPEVITLKEFFRTTKEGGKLTEEQAEKAFGNWDDNTGALVAPGILTPDQVAILYRVARGDAQPDDLNNLLPDPPGPLSITMDQAMQLQKTFTVEQIAPLMLIFQARANRRQQQG